MEIRKESAVFWSEIKIRNLDNSDSNCSLDINSCFTSSFLVKFSMMSYPLYMPPKIAITKNHQKVFTCHFSNFDSFTNFWSRIICFLDCSIFCSSNHFYMVANVLYMISGVN